MSQPSIAIDGPAGSGKSVIAKALARRLGLLYVDTGAMYRAVTWKAQRLGLSLDDGARVTALAEGLDLRLEAEPASPIGYRVLVDGETVTALLYTPEVDGHVGRVAAQTAVRRVLAARQRDIGLAGGVVMVGRDIATVVLPEARYKIYLDASLEERARRRLADLLHKGEAVNFDTVLAQMRERDKLDMGRDEGPLQCVVGAMRVDTTHATVDETLESILRLMENATPG
ncbi:MAG TPA: (d)CMP kinase [Candidatus Xenobia bacterium]